MKGSLCSCSCDESARIKADPVLFLLNSDRRCPARSLRLMRISAIRLLRATVMQKAPSHSPVSPQTLEALAARSWRIDRVARDNSQFKDCCGGSSSATTSKQQSELLSKDYKFRSFKEAWRFMSQVAEAAERLKVKRDAATALHCLV